MKDLNDLSKKIIDQILPVDIVPLVYIVTGPEEINLDIKPEKKIFYGIYLQDTVDFLTWRNSKKDSFVNSFIEEDCLVDVYSFEWLKFLEDFWNGEQYTFDVIFMSRIHSVLEMDEIMPLLQKASHKGIYFNLLEKLTAGSNQEYLSYDYIKYLIYRIAQVKHFLLTTEFEWDWEGLKGSVDDLLRVLSSSLNIRNDLLNYVLDMKSLLKNSPLPERPPENKIDKIDRKIAKLRLVYS